MWVWINSQYRYNQKFKLLLQKINSTFIKERISVEKKRFQSSSTLLNKSCKKYSNLYQFVFNARETTTIKPEYRKPLVLNKIDSKTPSI